MNLIPAHAPEYQPSIRSLLQEYATATGLDLSFQNFAAELAGLPGKYAPPEGCLILARNGTEAAGCVALRKHDDGVCEMKRLYVRPAFQSRGLGRELAVRIIQEARSAGYRQMLLDTLASMKPAISLYHSLGFTETMAYYHNPHADVRYFKLELR